MGKHKKPHSSAIPVTITMVYQAPNIPKTPSPSINKLLNTRFNHTYESLPKYVLAYYITCVFQAITIVYNLINKGQASHSKWMMSCGIIAAFHAFDCYLIYNIILASSIVLSLLIHYGCVLLALVGIGMGVAGAMFFDKEAAEVSSGPASPRPVLKPMEEKPAPASYVRYSSMSSSG